MNFFIILSYSVIFIGFLISIGRCLPRALYLPNSRLMTQALLFGLAIFIVILRLPYREDLPIQPFVLTLFFLALVGITNICRAVSKDSILRLSGSYLCS